MIGRVKANYYYSLIDNNLNALRLNMIYKPPYHILVKSQQKFLYPVLLSEQLYVYMYIGLVVYRNVVFRCFTVRICLGILIRKWAYICIYSVLFHIK